MKRALQGAEGLIVYLTLVDMVQSNKGIGFHNKDQGHLSYAGPAKGLPPSRLSSDGPDTNDVFKLLRDLSNEYGGEFGPRIETWEQFCRFAYNAYLRATGAPELT